MKIAVTGAAGYIGQLLIERLAARPEVDKITAIDLHRPARMPAKVEFHSCDIRDRKLVKLLEGADVIIHLAFIVAPIHDLQATYSINVGGSRNLLAAAEAVQPEKLIVASSVAAYGIQPPSVDIITEDTPLRGDSSSYYLHSKRLVEEHLDVFEKRNPQIVLTRLRPSILLGPRNNNFAREMGRFPVIPVVREGMHLPVVHEEDVIDAFELAYEKDAPGAFIISLPEPITLGDLSNKTGRRRIEVSFKTLLAISRLGYALHLTKLSPDWVVSGRTSWRFDLTRSREVLGWTPQHDVQTTIREMFETMEHSGRA